MKHRKLISRAGAAVFALFAAAVFFAAPVAGSKKGFSVSAFSPRGEVSGEVEITAHFTKAAVGKDSVGKKLAPSEAPFAFSPEIAGVGLWRDESTFVFTPAGGKLADATRYTAAARETLTSVDGEALSGASVFTFGTPPLSFVGAKQTDFDQQKGRVEFELEFSLPVSPRRLLGYAEVRDEKGGSLKFTLSQTVSDKIRLAVGAPEAEKLILSIAAGLPSEAGPLGLEKAVSVELERSLSMELRGSRAVSPMEGGRIIIETTAPVELAKAASFIEISPGRDFTVEPYDGGFAIASRTFRPRDRVRVTVKKGFPALAGRSLGAEWSRAFIFPDREPSVRFPGAGDGVISPEGSLRIPVESVNYDKLRVTVWRLYDNNIPLAAIGGVPGGYFQTQLSRLAVSREFSVKGKPNETARRALDLKPLLSGGRGVFLVSARGLGREGSEALATVNVTDLGLSVTRGRGGASARVLSIASAKPVAGAKVTLWSYSNQPVGSGVTDSDGVAAIKLEEGDPRGAPVAAVAEKEGDASVVRLNSSGLFGGNSEFDTEGEPWPEEGYSVFCWTSRGIFRPGDKIGVSAIVRGEDRRAPEPFPLEMRVYSPGRLQEKKTARLTEEGLFTSEIDVPQDAPTGVWGIELCLPGAERALCYKSVYVEDFAAPRLFVSAEAEPASVTGHGKASVNISAALPFGGQAAGLPWEAELRLTDMNFAPEGWKGFSFRDEEKEFSPERRIVGSGTLDGEGKASVSFDCGGWSAPSMLGLSLRAGVMDDGGRFTYKTAVVPWYPSEVMAGISMPDVPHAGRAAKFRVAAVKTDGTAASVGEMKYSLFRCAWRAMVFESDGRLARRNATELIPRGEGTARLSGGIGSAAFTADEPGEYLLRVETPDGSARASLRFYAYGAGDDGVAVLPDAVIVTTDKKVYKTGETARIKIKSPFAGSATLAVSSASPLLCEVRETSGKTAEFLIPVTKEMKPNAWITAQVTRKAQADGEPSRAFGAAPLMVDNSEEKLAVALSAPPKIEPGKNSFSVTVKDSEGKGVPARVAVILADETVLGLTDFKTPAPWEFFSARRQLAADLYDLYGSMIQPEKPSTPLLAAGGGMASPEEAKFAADTAGGGLLSPVQARRFRVLCVTGQAAADESGRAALTLDVPEFSGEARLMAVAVSRTAEGSSDAHVRVARDIVTEVAFPRFAAPGDLFSASCRLFNTTGRAIEATFRAESTDGAILAVRGDSGAEKKITIEANGSAVVPLSFEAGGAGTAKARFTVKWPGGESVTETELPVRPAAPRVTASGFKTLAPGESWNFSLPGRGRDGDANYARVYAALSAMPQLSVSSLARMLSSGGAGDLGSTVASAWARVAALGAEAGTGGEEDIKTAIKNIESRQNYDGGFSRRGGEGESRPWESLCAAHFLFEANSLGFPVAEETLRAAADYARSLLPLSPETDSDDAWRETLTRRAFASFVLAASGEAPLGWMESLGENAAQMTPAGRLLLASAYAAAHEPSAALSLTGKPSARTESGGDPDSALLDSSLLLLARVYADPGGAETAAQAATLIDKINSGANITAREGSFAMAALSRWFAANPQSGAPSGVLSAGGFSAKVSSAERTVSSALPGEYSAKNSGRAPLYAAWSVSYIPSGAAAERDDGIVLRQRVTERNGKALADGVKRGTALTATVTVTPKAGTLENVAVTLPLPACFEIESPNLTDDEESGYAGGVTAEARDDRLLLFIDRLEAPLTWRYSMRAVTAGKFAVPQIYAESLYNAGASSVSGGGVISVNE